ncbi:MAG: hypothetical protein KHW94_09250 [Clostridium sp.]|nr:hypothetical protein [Clostridium sp.]
MDAVSGIFLNALGTDMTAMEQYFPFVTEAFSIFQYTAWALLFLITVWQLFRVFGGPVTEAENPWQLLARSAIFAILIGYAKPIFLLALDIARAPYTALMDATMDPGGFTFAGVEQVLQNGLSTLVSTITVIGPLLTIILMISLGWNYFKMLLECVERYVVVGVLCYTSPLAFSMGGSKTTNNVFKGWTRMVGSQLLLLVLNVWFLRAFNSTVGQFVGNGGALSSGQGSIFLWMFVALAFLKTAQKFDSYLAAMGLNVAQTGSSMGMELLMAARVISGVASGGARTAGSVFRGANGTAGASGTAATSGGFFAGFASRFKPNSYVRDAVVEGGTRMGASGSAGFVARAFGGMAARNGATLSSESIASVAARPGNVSGTIAGEIADRSTANYMPQLQGYSLSCTEITGGRISTVATGADGKTSEVEMFSASQFERPSMPHSTVTAKDGSQWYQTATGDGAGSFYTPAAFAGLGAGETLSQDQVSAAFGDSVADGTTLRTVGHPEEGVLEASHPDYGASMWYNSAMYQEPDAPHDTIQSTDGVGWYAMQPHNDVPKFESPTDEAKAYNQAQFQSFMPGYETQPAYVDTSRARDGVIDVRHEDGSAMRFYDHTQFQAPCGDYTVYEDKRGGQWYAIPGTPVVERRPVYEGGKPVYDCDQVKTRQVEAIRYKSTLTRYADPQPRDMSEKKPPKRKQ